MNNSLLANNIYPLKEFIVYIEGIGTKGDGIAKIDNFIIIVIGGELHQTYKVKIKRRFDNFALAEIIQGLNTQEKQANIKQNKPTL